jgi:hypothetical protein
MPMQSDGSNAFCRDAVRGVQMLVTPGVSQHLVVVDFLLLSIDHHPWSIPPRHRDMPGGVA